MAKMEWGEIAKAVNAEIDAARRYIDNNRMPERVKRWDRYYGRPYGNEMKGRSKFISRDLMEAVEWTLPYLIRQFASGDPKINIMIEGQEPWVGQALMNQIQEDLNSGQDESLFRAFYEWFKDSMVSDTGFCKVGWELDYEQQTVTWPQLGLDQMNELAADPDVQIQGFEEVFDGATGQYVYANVRTRVRVVRKYGLTVSGLPHWEFICAADSRTINDEHPKGHQTKVTLDYLKRVNRARGGDYFKGLEALEREVDEETSKRAWEAPTDDGETERQRYYDEQETTGQDMPAKGGRKEYLLTEWFTRLDIDGDGYLEDVVCWMADKHLLRYEDNSEGILPICGLSPILDCYRLFGISYSDLIVPIQNLMTMVTRRVLDNFDFQNLGLWFSKDPSIDARRLLNPIPGDLIRGDPTTTQRMDPQPFHPSVLNLLEYIKGMKEDRIGNTRYNQGTDADSLNKTARGMEMIMSAAQQRMELIARVFAETGLRDFYRKCAMLYQIYRRKPFVTRVRGREVEVTPDMLQGTIKVTVDMGVEAEVGMIEARKIQEMFGFQSAIDQRYPGALGLQQVHNMMTRHAASLGFRDTDEYVIGLKQWAEILAQKSEAGTEQAQMAMAMAQAKMLLEQDKLRLQSAKAMSDIETKDRELALEEHKAETDARLKLLGVVKDERPQVVL